MNKLRLVLDTNILISASLLGRSLPYTIVRDALVNHLILTSPETYGELNHQLLLPNFDRYVSREKRQHFLLTFLFAAKMVDVRTSVDVCRDPTDNTFLALLIDGKAGYLITGDKDLLALHPFRHTSVVTPRQFLEHVKH